MAANKPKKSATKSKAKAKNKTAVKSEKTAKPVVEAKEKKVEKVEKVEKPEVIEDKVEETTESEEIAEAEVTEVVEPKKACKKEEKEACEDADECCACAKKTGFFKTVFARKCSADENILTIFHNRKLWGALMGEVIGTMLISIVLLTLGVYQPLYMFFIVAGATLVTFGLSGANLNPIITAGMMASRRMSAIRGVLYILAQILGAWFGYLIVNAFFNAGAMTSALPAMTTVASETFWAVTMVEFFGAALIGFFFVRALQMKKSPLAFAVTVGAGFLIAFVSVIVISSTYLSLTSNFILNPAVALMYQILPTGGDNAADLLADIALALVTYVIFPVLGGIVGFFVSDIASTFNEEKVEM